MAEVQSVREFVANVVNSLHSLEVRYSEPRVTPLPYFETMAIFDQVLAAHDAAVKAEALPVISTHVLDGLRAAETRLRHIEHHWPADTCAEVLVLLGWLNTARIEAESEAESNV